jgi:hypothetical protein
MINEDLIATEEQLWLQTATKEMNKMSQKKSHPTKCTQRINSHWQSICYIFSDCDPVQEYTDKVVTVLHHAIACYRVIQRAQFKAKKQRLHDFHFQKPSPSASTSAAE